MAGTSSFRRCDGVTRRDFVAWAGSRPGAGPGHLLKLQAAAAEGARSRQRPRPRSAFSSGSTAGQAISKRSISSPTLRPKCAGRSSRCRRPSRVFRFASCFPQQRRCSIRWRSSAVGYVSLGEHNLGTLPAHRVQADARGRVPELRLGGGELASRTRSAPAAHCRSELSRGRRQTGRGQGFLRRPARPFSVGGDPPRPISACRDLDFYPGSMPNASSGGEVPRRPRRLQPGSRIGREPSPPIPNSSKRPARHVAGEAKEAFDLLERAGRDARQRYGPRTIGQSCLLARRLVERGVPFVTVNNPGWDTHQNQYTQLKEGYTGAKIPVGLVPSLDLAFSGLVSDLAERGLLDETLVVVMGGVRPHSQAQHAGGPRSLARASFSVAMAGGGIPGGQVIGSATPWAKGPRTARLRRPIWRIPISGCWALTRPTRSTPPTAARARERRRRCRAYAPDQCPTAGRSNEPGRPA